MLINSKGARAALQWGNLTIPPWGTISNGTNRHPGVLAGGPEKTVTSMRILPKMHPLKLQKNTQGKFYAVTACAHQKIKISVRGHGAAASGHLACPGPRPLLQW